LRFLFLLLEGCSWVSLSVFLLSVFPGSGHSAARRKGYCIRVLFITFTTASLLEAALLREPTTITDVAHLPSPLSPHSSCPRPTLTTARPHRSTVFLAVSDFAHGPVIADVNVQPLRLVIHAHHIAFLDDAVFARKVLFREGLVCEWGVLVWGRF